MSLPRVEFTENVMREGMQIESVNISVDDKLRLLDALGQTGLASIVVGSFVSPKYTPQMAAIDELMRRFVPVAGVRYTYLALNGKGHERAAQYIPPLVPETFIPATFVHACDTFARRNANQSQDAEIASWVGTIEEARRGGAADAGIGLGAAFGSNFEGPFTVAEGMDLLDRQHRAWTSAGVDVTSVYIADPMGWCTPWQTEELLTAIRDTYPTIVRFDVHLHNARGLALASTYEAMRVLDERHLVHFDTTLGGIGGCPYCGTGRATGMVATEDLVNMLEQLGIPTGVDLAALIRASWDLETLIGRPTVGFVSKAGPHPQQADLYDPNLPFVETLDEARHFLLGESVIQHPMRPWREPIPEARRAVR